MTLVMETPLKMVFVLTKTEWPRVFGINEINEMN